MPKDIKLELKRANKLVRIHFQNKELVRILFFVLIISRRAYFVNNVGPVSDAVRRSAENHFIYHVRSKIIVVLNLSNIVHSVMRTVTSFRITLAKFMTMTKNVVFVPMKWARITPRNQ